jgi:hypothetical protein
MRTYSALRSQVHTVADVEPAPRSTEMRMSSLQYSAASGAASSMRLAVLEQHR